ncbi:hypothetical protein C922_04503 [Plasmodium inui San Antonio 1]|uniref:Plasmodium RESA N-terminal domain-containing protein n=1 Tax=Plasmodium inui San Antonio 1 TaxID=1237626 RepID=W7A1B3_9APIC|nr:hypothetical protein C922_04503 [Plasmodium inui San Antonio 1]EUD65103.1 hypothetical protein C922_04503 [Plasmodium inui San Antonio 1]
MALTTDYSKLSDVIHQSPESPTLYNQAKYHTQKQNDSFYEIKRFMCLGSTISDDAKYDVDLLLNQGDKKCKDVLTESFKVIGYKYCTTNNNDNVRFAKLFYDHYANLFYCMHLHNDDKKCNSLFKHFYEKISPGQPVAKK